MDDSDITPLQQWVREQMAEQGFSYRQASEASGGLISHTVFSRLMDDARWDGKVQEKTILGLAKAFEATDDHVRSLVEASRPQDLHYRLYRRLPPDDQAVILKIMRDMLKARSVERLQFDEE